MKSKYIIFPELRLIVESFCGEMNIDGYLKFKSGQIQDVEYNPEYNILADLRWVGFDFKASEVSVITDFLKENVKTSIPRKGSLLTNDPLQTAYSMVFKKLVSEHGINYQVCTTLQEALRWVDSPMSEQELGDVLAHLKAELNIVL